MRYNSILEIDQTNGIGIGQCLFVQGCPHHCKGCFNEQSWDFNGGKEFTNEIKNKFIKLSERPYIDRVTILGGEPLCCENMDDVLSLIKELKNNKPELSIWVYTGGLYEKLYNDNPEYMDELCKYIDVLVDGPFILEKRDLSLHFRGSSNQRLINIKKSSKWNTVHCGY